MANLAQSTRKHRPPVIEQFRNFTPDEPVLESPGLTLIRNVFPLTNGRYGPVYDLVAESLNTLREIADVERVVGTIGAYRNLDNGNVFLFAGGASAGSETLRLFMYTESQRQWSDVTRAQGSYNFSAVASVRFAQHGDDMFCAVGRGAPLQVMKVNTDDRFSNVVGAPNPVDVAVVREFLMVCNFSLGGESFPDSFMWSSQADPRVWPAPGTIDALKVNSGLIQIPGGGRLHRIIPGVGGSDAIAVAESRLWRITFAGRPSIWQTDVAAYDDGTSVPGSVASNSETLFYVGRDGPRAFNGSTSTPIADKQIAKTWLKAPNEDLAAFEARPSQVTGFQNAITAAIDADNKLYLLSYRNDRGEDFEAILDHTGDPILTHLDEEILTITTSAGNNCIWAFNYASGHWGHCFLEVDAMSLVESERTALDTPRLVAMGPDTALSTFRGQELEAIFEGPERVAKDGQQDTIYRVLPGIDSDNVQVYARIRNTLGAAPKKTLERRIDNDGYAPLGEAGVSARYWRIGLRMPATVNWTFALGYQAELGEHGQGPVR